MLAASLLGETSIATPSSVTEESLTHSFAEMSFGQEILILSFLRILWPCLGNVCAAFGGFTKRGFYFLIGMTGAKGMVTCVRPKTKKIQLRRLPRVLWLRASWALVWRVNPESYMTAA